MIYLVQCNEMLIYLYPDVFILQVFGWNTTGTIEFNDFFCRNNSAAENGGCFYGAGRALVNNGTVMLDNVAKLGGCICESTLNASVVPPATVPVATVPVATAPVAAVPVVAVLLRTMRYSTRQQKWRARG